MAHSDCTIWVAKLSSGSHYVGVVVGGRLVTLGNFPSFNDLAEIFHTLAIDVFGEG